MPQDRWVCPWCKGQVADDRWRCDYCGGLRTRTIVVAAFAVALLGALVWWLVT